VKREAVIAGLASEGLALPIDFFFCSNTVRDDWFCVVLLGRDNAVSPVAGTRTSSNQSEEFAGHSPFACVFSGRYLSLHFDHLLPCKLFFPVYALSQMRRVSCMPYAVYLLAA